MKCVEVQQDLSIRLSESNPSSGTSVVPIEIPKGRKIIDISPMAQLVYYEVMYPMHYAAMRKSGSIETRSCLGPPPPWLVVLGAIMWEGIIQGMTWDYIKSAANVALASLADLGFSPVMNGTQQVANGSQESTTRVTAGWTEYVSSGKRKYEFFLQLRRVAKKKGAIRQRKG